MDEGLIGCSLMIGLSLDYLICGNSRHLPDLVLGIRKSSSRSKPEFTDGVPSDVTMSSNKLFPIRYLPCQIIEVAELANSDLKLIQDKQLA
jgi:hypothetical protein